MKGFAYGRYLGVILLLLVIPACGAKKEEKAKSLPPALVAITAAQLKDVPIEIKTFGTMEPAESVTIKPMVSGELTRVAFREGADVHEGELLFEIDPRPYEAALNKALASQAKNRVIGANARKDYARYSQLVKAGIVTQEQTEAYRTRAETAEADLAADQAQVATARTQLSYCTIKAPISGRMGVLAMDRGNVVKANDTTLVTINQITPILATFTIPEQQLATVQERLGLQALTVRAEVPGSLGMTEEGRVSFVDNAVDPATGTIRLKAEFTNPEKRLWPGQYVSLTMTLEVRKGAVVVPTQALQTGQNGQFLFVVKPEQTAEVRPVVPGPVYQGGTVIDQGLKAGEQVVIDGQMRIIPGGKVEVKGAKGKEGKANGGKGEAAPGKGPAPSATKGEAAGR
jgi:multidrug efflux system membrane fusion protein